jgi:uncharacterized membrane protein YdbT with pleckstrin-like domain
MSYVSQTSGAVECVRFRAHYHWLYWLGGIVLATGPLLTFAAGPIDSWAGLAVLCVTVVGVPFGLVILVRAFATEIAVTSDRFIKKGGLISFESEDISLDKVEEINLEESILGALFGYGTLVVHGSGTGSIRVEMVQSPERLRREIESAREALR